MLITRKCPFTGTLNDREIDVTQEQLEEWNRGTLAQNAFPNLTPSEREFIMTGITDEVWDDIFGEDDQNEVS